MEFKNIQDYFKTIEFDPEKQLTRDEIHSFLSGKILDESISTAISKSFHLYLWCLDLRTMAIHILPEAYTILGIEPGQYDYNLIRGLEQVVHPNYVEYIKENAIRGLLELNSDPFTFKIIRNNEEAWIVIKGHAFKNDIRSGYAVGFIADVTEIMGRRIMINEQELFLDAFLEAVPTPLYFKDLNSRYLNCNQAFLNHLGRTRSTLIGKTTHEVHRKEAADYYCAKDQELLQEQATQIYDAWVENTNHEKRLVRFHKNVIRDGEGVAKGIVGAMNDITESDQKERKLERLNRLLESLMEISHDVLSLTTYEELFDVVIHKAMDAIEPASLGAVLLRDENDYVKMISQVGYDPNEFDGFKLPIQDTFLWRFRDGKMNQPIIINDLGQVALDHPDIMPKGFELTISSSLTTPINLDDEVIAIMSLDSYEKDVYDEQDIELMTIVKNQIELVIRNMRLYQQVVHVSQTDPLTGIYNRGYFETTLAAIIKKASRYNESFCLALVDLNNLKIVNDLLGHNIGDQYIQNFVETFKAAIRDSDLLARFGGDEFIAVFFESDQQQLANRLEMINRQFMKSELVNDLHIIQSFSYGIAHFPRDSEKYNELVRIADERMYHYKRILKSGMYYRPDKEDI